MNVSKHARERYLERINPNADSSTVNDLINQTVENSTYVWTEEGDGEFYITSGMTLFVVRDGTIVTCYVPDYGMGEEVNKDIAKKLLKEVQKKRVGVDKINDAVDQEIFRLEGEKEKIQKQIDYYISLLDVTEKEINLNKIKLQSAKDDLAIEAERLVKSVNYRIEKAQNKINNQNNNNKK